MLKPALLTTLLLCGASAFAAGPFTGNDISGVYTCTGQDVKDGAYTITATFRINHDQSTGNQGSYQVHWTVPGLGDYVGIAVSDGSYIAASFANTKPGSKDYGLGLATTNVDMRNQLHFSNFYFEPDYKGGDHGTEDCVQQSP